MTDETVHIQPAIPSRAAQAPASPFEPAAPQFPSPGTRPAPVARGKRRSRLAKKAKALSPAEIKKINAKRAAALAAAKPKKKKAKKRTRTIRQIIQAAPRETGRAKNPNRPLEMKNQLSAVLSMVGTLQKAELVFFSQAVPAMQALSRSGRKRVIAALQQVYG